MNRKRIRELVYQKYGGHCAYCGKKIGMKDMQIDHFVPILRGWSDEYINAENSRENYELWAKIFKQEGKPIPAYEEYKIVRGMDELSNYMPACRACNFRKGTMDIENFRKEVGLQAERLMQTFQGRMSAAYGLITYTPHKVEFYFEKNKQQHLAMTEESSLKIMKSK